MKNIFRFFGLIAIAALVTLLFSSRDRTFFNEGSENSFSEEKEAGGSLEYMQFLSEQRVFPNKDIPSDAYFKGYEHSKNNLQEFDNGDSPTQWTSIGPYNVGGRSLCIAINPQDTSMLFMGSASGGMWKSTTGGLGASAWSYVETGYPSLAVSYIQIDSANPNIMYIGTGENYGYQYSQNGVNIRVTRGMYGIGILKTTDGGASWVKSLDWSYNNQRGVWRVCMNPKRHSTLYAATSEGVYKTNNSGTTWSQVAPYKMVMDLKVDPVDTTVIYISVGDLSNDVANPDVGIYKTSNAGTSWVKMTGGLPAFWSGKVTLDIYPGTPSIIYASIGNDPNQASSYLGLWWSTDGGTTWSIKYNNTSFMTNQGWYNNAFIVKPGDPNSMLLGNLDVYRSVNGGSTFTSMSNWGAWNQGATPPGQPESGSSNFSHADQHYFAVNPKDPNKFYSITDGGLYRSNDFGTTYYSCNGGYVTTQFYNGFVNSYQDSVWCLGGLQDNRAVFYQGSPGWYKTFSGDGMWCAVSSATSNTCYVAYSWGQVSRSNNGGVSWSGLSIPGTGNESSYCFAAPYICCRSNPSIMYIGGTSIYRSSNAGTSWSGPYGSFAGAKVLSIDASSTFTDTVYAGTMPVSGGANATIWRTTDGITWVNVGAGAVPNAYPSDIHVNPNNSKDVYVTFSGFGTPHVYHSIDAGLSWLNITGNLPDVPHQSVVIDPLYPQNVYVGNDLGVYVTTNNGAAWFEYRVGMPYAMVFDLSIVNTNRHIRATTHGHGVYERSLVQLPVGITPVGNNVPKSYGLYQNYPNPFNPSTKIKFDIPIEGNGRDRSVLIKLYDISGREVETLVNKSMNPGTYEVTFDASKYSSGVYFYKLTAGDFTQTKKMLLVK